MTPQEEFKAKVIEEVENLIEHFEKADDVSDEYRAGALSALSLLENAVSKTV